GIVLVAFPVGGKVAAHFLDEPFQPVRVGSPPCVRVDFGVLSRIKTPFPGEKDKCIAYPLTPTKKALIYAGLKGSKA
ncbi:hypothetical protein, partial [Anaeromassilibacillus sp. D41t1_190614_C2]|uniref:hypothetical protein n=1 Tax=Anaeromassilibacillus sp. D41t1_190614_C2 TaxID=2787078 RepID=UPI001A9B5930